MKLFGKSNKHIKKDRYRGAFAAEIQSTRNVFYIIFSSFFYTSLMVLTFIILLWFFHQLNNNKKFAIHHIDFVGPMMHLSTDILQKTSLPFNKKNFFTVNIFALKKRLKILPWLHEVTISRTWPDGLSIHIKEQEPIARLQKNKLLNKQLEIFTVPPSTMPEYLPEFNGPAGQLKVMWQNYQTIETILTPIKLHVVYFELSERQSWRLQLNNGLKLVLGRDDGLDHLRRFVEVYNQIMTNQNVGIIDYIDLRYSNGIALSTRSL